MKPPFSTTKGVHHDDTAVVDIVPSNSMETVKTSSKTGHHRRELEALILRVILLEKTCVEEQTKDKQKEMMDTFFVTKRELLAELKDIFALVRSCNNIQRSKGNTVEVLQKRVQLDDKFKKADDLFSALKVAFKNQSKKKGKGLTDEQLNERFNELESISQHMASIRTMYRNDIDTSDSRIKTLSAFLEEHEKNDQSGIGGGNYSWRELTKQEQQVHDQWNRRDAEIDNQVDAIGSVIDRLMENAIEIGQKAEKQSQRLNELHNQADRVSEDLQFVNESIGTVIKNQTTMNLALKFTLSFFIVVLLSYIIPTVRKRIIG